MNSRCGFSTGDVIAGRHVIEGQQESSSSVRTFSANENHSQNKICLKIFRPDPSQTPQSSDEFLPRAKILPALSHDNLAIVHDVQESEGK
ncbi:MAG: hypothetical protein IPJ33_07975 [Gammaproteobacteria bacterium]|jgi:hypothetical protein|nr:hypothetical protein [Gammaproteobacteria bacterium]MBP6051943.1 hypothetical protein [Pseudomonadales bacterium]MBK6581836.1 hypothetical protein [Gammaproteobacteria bacterium]MBK7520672.1 hypothetical protein [Gammaproteobacteria bacterium]MBK7728415.1 hypothetical protein [Gammaproteobacteria bacterium]